MKKRYILLGLLYILLALSETWAQGVNVTGSVKDQKTGEVLPGVSISVKGTTLGAISKEDGTFALPVSGANSVLVFSYLGYKPYEVQVQSRTTFNITLESDSKMLDELVVVGYGTLNKSEIASSIASVKTDDILKTIPRSINEGLQGQVAGVQVNRGDGAPGAGISMTIRGANSFSGSEPLYVIDDVPFTPPGTPRGAEDNIQTINVLSYINPQDIESIEVLKDAAATAIYGSRGANGVVMITTKKGKAGKDRVELTTNFSLSQISKKLDMLSAAEYASFQNEAYANAFNYEGGVTLQTPYPGTIGPDRVLGISLYRPKPEDYINGLPEGSNAPTGFKGTNWFDQITRDAVSQDYTLNFSGGNDKGSYSISGNYLDQEGIITNTGFNRYGLQFNIHRNIGKFLTIGTNNNITFSKYILGKSNTSGSQPSLISSALYFPPTNPVEDIYTEARENDPSLGLNSNPYTFVMRSKDETYTTRIYTGSFAELKILPSLSFRQRLGYTYNTNSREVYYGRDLAEARAANGRAIMSENNNNNLVLESVLTFKKKVANVHDFNVVADFSYEKGIETYLNLQASNFPTDITKNFNLYSGLQQELPQNGRFDWELMSVLGRFNYSYAGKYILSASFRRDGSTRLSAGNKIDHFGAVALAWNAHQEKFIENLNIFSNLKFRASYGQTGNQSVSPYQTLSALLPANAIIDGKVQSGFAIDQNKGIIDQNLKWETTTQMDVGVDFGFFRNKFSFIVDYYHKRTEDLLQAISVPTSTGYSIKVTNFGTIENKGLEFTGVAVIKEGSAFRWDVNANLSFNRNKIMDLPADQFAQRLWHQVDEVFIQRNGLPMGAVYGYLEDGYYDNVAEVKADPQFANFTEAELLEKVGEIKYKNLDNDPTSISNSDRTIIGDTNPDYTFGITNNFNYKKFSLSVFFQGVVGGDIVNANLLKVGLGQMSNIPQYIYDERWTPETAATAEWPKALASSTRTFKFSDRYVKDATYVRLKNINFGYTLNPRRYFQSVYVYGSISNLFTFTDYEWFDPDVNSFGGNPSRRGVDMNAYPNSRVFTLGLKLSL